MKKLLASALFTLSSFAYANLHLAPPDFETGSGKAIFVDFKKAHYDLTYHGSRFKVLVKSRIEFEAKSEGMPVFDLLPNPGLVTLDGEAVEQEQVKTPDGATTYRMVKKAVRRGKHVLEIENTFKSNVLFSASGRVASAFWIRDLKERKFLEQYVPSNMEFDQYKMDMTVHFVGQRFKPRQEIFTNGELTIIDPYTYKISFPEYYTVSCPYFHTVPKGWMNVIRFSYKSVSGRWIPVTVYSPWFWRTKNSKSFQFNT